MYIINNDDDLREILKKEKDVYVYGAGKIAQTVFSALSFEEISKINRIILTQKPPKYSENELVKEVSDTILTRDIVVLNLTGKPYKFEIEQQLLKEGFQNQVMISDEYEIELNRRGSENTYIYSVDIVQCIERIKPRTRLKTLVVNICDHCNLNCQSCDHFSPLAEPRCIDKEIIKSDLIRIHEILDENIDRIAIMGGEPLLHPELIEIMVFARKIFRKVDIMLSTSGLLLRNCTDEFWSACRDNAIKLSVTKYPVAFDYTFVEEKSKKEGVAFCYYSGGDVVKTSYHLPLDLEGGQDPKDSFINCFHANNRCNMLSEGKLWTCTVAPNFWIFEKFYGVNLPISKKDGIDIYSIKNSDELFEKLAEPMSACRYCNVRKRSWGHSWKRSEREMSEWTI